MKILFHYTDYSHTPDRDRLNTYGGLGYYRIIKVAEQVKKMGEHEVVIMGKEILHFGITLEEQWDNIFKEYDVFWTLSFPDEHIGAMMVYQAQKHGKKIVLDVDDNYLDVPESNKLYERFKPTKRDRAMLSTILSFADVITVSTEPIKEKLFNHFQATQGLKKKIVVLPNMNDVADWNFTPVQKHDDKIVIGYSGSNSHQDDLKLIMPALINVMEKHKNVYFETIGVIEKEKVPFYFKGMSEEAMNRCSLLPATSTFKEYPQYLSEQKWNIGIAPLVDSAFTRCKSHIKWLEYSMYKIPTLASRVYPYFMELQGHDIITDEETGLLAKPFEWEEKLERLVVDGELRNRLGNNAYEYVRKNWQYDLRSQINRVFASL